MGFKLPTFGDRVRGRGGSGRAFVSGALPRSFFGQIRRHWGPHRMCTQPVGEGKRFFFFFFFLKKKRKNDGMGKINVKTECGISSQNSTKF